MDLAKVFTQRTTTRVIFKNQSCFLYAKQETPSQNRTRLMLIKLYLQTENYMQQIREQQEKIELQNSIIAKLKSQLAALNANRGMYSSLHIIAFYAVLHWWILLTLLPQFLQYTYFKWVSYFPVNVRVNTNVPFQDLFIKFNTSGVSLYPLWEMVRFSIEVESAYTEANKSYENMGSNHSLQFLKIVT